MNSKHEILSKLKRQLVDRVALPEVVTGNWIDFDDPVQQFMGMVELAGGSCQELSDLSELPAKLQGYTTWKDARAVFSGIAEIPGTVELDAVDDPHDLENLDFVIYRGELAVAENGAVWLTDRDLRHRVVFFITQYLILVVDKRSIVPTMHEAYAQIQAPSPGFGLFLSGPSKTADIEQSLVIGAHGCRELQVYLI